MSAENRGFCALCEKYKPTSEMNIVGHAWICFACADKVPTSYVMLATLAAASVDKLIDAIDRLTEAVEAAGDANA